MFQKISGIIVGNCQIFKSLHSTSNRNLWFIFKFILQHIRQFFNLFQNAVVIILFKTDNRNRTVIIYKCDSSVLGIHHAHADIFNSHCTEFSVILLFCIHSLFQKNQAHFLLNIKLKIFLENIQLHLFICFCMHQISHALLQSHLHYRALRAPHSGLILLFVFLLFQFFYLLFYRIEKIIFINRFQEEILHLKPQALSCILKIIKACKHDHTQFRY